MSLSSQEERKNFKVGEEVKESLESSFAEKNEACITGFIEEKFQYSHSCYGQNFYKTRVIVERRSGTVDFVPVVVSESLKNKFFNDSEEGKYVRVAGRFSSRSVIGEDGKRHLHLFIFASDIIIYEGEECVNLEKNRNTVYLKGYICMPPIYRITPSGKEITELKIAVKRPLNNPKADYIPCIAWGGTANYVRQLEVGDVISIRGRIQSREYFKKCSLDTGEGEYKTTYEVSVMKLD